MSNIQELIGNVGHKETIEVDFIPILDASENLASATVDKVDKVSVSPPVSSVVTITDDNNASLPLSNDNDKAQVIVDFTGLASGETHRIRVKGTTTNSNIMYQDFYISVR
jgi:hypothetical protein